MSIDTTQGTPSRFGRECRRLFAFRQERDMKRMRAEGALANPIGMHLHMEQQPRKRTSSAAAHDPGYR